MSKDYMLEDIIAELVKFYMTSYDYTLDYKELGKSIQYSNEYMDFSMFDELFDIRECVVNLESKNSTGGEYNTSVICPTSRYKYSDHKLDMLSALYGGIPKGQLLQLMCSGKGTTKYSHFIMDEDIFEVEAKGEFKPEEFQAKTLSGEPINFYNIDILTGREIE